jgi:hypothetical protein
VNLTTAELLALAVLRGDRDAALPLADAVLEAHGGTSRGLPPVKRITAERSKLRVLAYVNDTAYPPNQDDMASWREAINAWLAGERDPLFLTGVDRVELYELP